MGSSETLAGRLRAVRERAFVGRAAELELFRASLAGQPPPFAVLHVHGPGGVGKTALLRRWASEAGQAGRTVVALDGRRLDVSPAGFLAALADARGAADGERALAGLPPDPVLLVDTYEELAALDGWLREELLPQLPARALVVLAGRDPPAAAWHADPGWGELLRVVALHNLGDEDARALMTARGVDDALHEQVLAFTGGHPLALILVAAADGPLVRSPDVIAALVERFVRDVPGEEHRRALDVCAHARITTESVLRAALPEARADELFDWLSGLSFVERSPAGIYPHDLAREALEAHLRWRDPERWADLHDRLRRHFGWRVIEVPEADSHRAFLDLLFVQRGTR